MREELKEGRDLKGDYFDDKQGDLHCGGDGPCQDFQARDDELSETDLQRLFVVSRRITGKINPQETISASEKFWIRHDSTMLCPT